MQVLLSRIQIRLLLLVFLVLTPFLGKTILDYQEQKQQAITTAQQDALHYANMAAKDQDYLFEGARQLLAVMAQVPELNNQDEAACNRFLASLRRQFPVYMDLGVVNTKGTQICSAISSTQSISWGDYFWFQRTITTGEFVAGDYSVSPISGKPVLTNAYPVKDKNGQVSLVVYAEIDMRWLDNFVAEAKLPEGSTFTMVDQNGVILTRYPDAEAWRGQSLPTAVTQNMVSQNEGVYESKAADGVQWLYGFTQLCCLPWRSIYVVVGIPKETTLAGVNHTLARNLSIFSLIVLVGCVISGGGAELFILRPLGKLLKVINRFDIGDFSARVGLTSGGMELNRIANALDKMAATVEARETEHNRTEEVLRLQSTRAEAVATIAARLNAHLDLQLVLDTVCQETAQALVVPATSVSLYDETHNTMSCVSYCGLPEDFYGAMDDLELNNFIPELKLGEIIDIPSAQQQSENCNLSKFEKLGVVACTCNPLIYEGSLVGSLCVFVYNADHHFTDEELTFLKAISDQAAQAIVNARLYETIRENQSSRMALLEKTISAQEDERKRIARELHDQTSQDLAALMLDLDTCALGLTTNDTRPAQHIKAAKTLVTTILTNIHHLINDLRPSLLDDLGLASAIQWYGEQRLKPVGIALDFQCNRVEARLPPLVETSLFRITQEALTNVVRHAHATKVKVIMDVNDRTVSLSIEDNGIGFQVSEVILEQSDGRGLGLCGMQERVAILGGKMHIQSTPGKCTLIHLEVPLLEEGNILA